MRVPTHRRAKPLYCRWCVGCVIARCEVIWMETVMQLVVRLAASMSREVIAIAVTVMPLTGSSVFGVFLGLG